VLNAINGLSDDDSAVQRRLAARTRAALAFMAALLSASVVVGVAVPTAEGLAPRIYPGGGVVPLGDATFEGSPNITLNTLVTGMATTQDGKGYWLVGADGGVFTSGDARFFGSLGALSINGPVVGIATTADGGGYWLTAMDGGVFSFGDARFFGSMGATPLNQPVVGIAATPDSKGYWLVAADGGIFTFGDAQFYGSTGNMQLNAPVVGMAATPDGKGYWLVAADGGIFTFGDAQFYGSLGNQDNLPASIVGMSRSPDGKGYWLAGYGGGVYNFGDTQFYGQTSGNLPASPVTAIAATPDGGGYWLLQPDDWNYSFSDAPPYELPVSSQIVSVASGQIQGDPNAGQGAFCNPYGPCEEWCALFATWVWRQAGIPIPSYSFTGNIYYWAAAHTALLGAASLPAPGDAVLYGSGPQTVGTSVHTGIVVEVWPDGAVITVEGDAGPAPTGELAVVTNGPFLTLDSQEYNGFGVYAFAQPVG
jgi:hypothetical protein